MTSNLYIIAGPNGAGKTTFAKQFLPNYADGYRIHIFFLWIQSVDIALARIADRVRRGGHAVDENVVRRRYTKSISNFFYRYRPLGDYWAIFDNSTDSPSMIACEESGKIKIYDQYLFYEISHVAGKQ
jgi:predicted ABC-type ATPase